MRREVEVSGLSTWIELVCRAGDQHVRDRVLLECVLALGCARAAALWRPASAGAGANERADSWRMVLARGPTDVLPQPALFDSLRRRNLPQGSIPGVRVFATTEVALALGGVEADDEALDIVEALLVTYALMSVDGLDDAVAPPLPSAPRESAESRRLRHDINNVLTSLRATEDLLHHFSDGLSADEQARFCKVVEHECARVGELLASAVRETPGAAQAACEPALVVARVLDAEDAHCARAHVAIRRYMDPPASGVRIALSALDLGRLVQNLVVNAREAQVGRASGSIWVTLENAGTSTRPALRLVVEDDGPGFPDMDLEKLFTPGFSTKAGPNAGQGLAIVRALAEKGGGSVRPSPRASGGARFTVEFPVADS